MNFIKSLDEITKQDVLIAGGKGASLGEMRQANIPVPQGFVILSDVFDAFIKSIALDEKIQVLLCDAVNSKRSSVEHISKEIQSRILSNPVPHEIRAEIMKGFDSLNSEFVAVRSSATLEDSASTAWAGQLDTYLNTTKDELLGNIQKCWASLFSPKATFYRLEHSLNKRDMSLAVVIQEMLDSEKSGIAFSVHPVLQNKNQMIIEAGFGLGESIVSGLITPDSYVVNKNELKILGINHGNQSRGLYRKSVKGGNEWRSLVKNLHKQVLDEAEIIELSKLIIDIEQLFGFPVDIEWAKANDKFYITQSRPITTLDVL